MSDLGETAPLTQYLHDHVWESHLPGGGYDVDRLAQSVGTHFNLAAADLPALRELAGQVAAAHCPQCGATVQTGGRECFCCGWTRA